MTDAKPQINTRALPSEMALLLLLLAVTVLLNALFVANWLAELEQGGTGAVLTNTLMLVLPGLAVFGLLSSWRTRRSTPLRQAGLHDAAKTVTELVREVAPPRPTEVRLGKHLGGRAYVTGPPGKPIVVLGPELLALHAMPGERRAVFEAVVRHELAHVHAGDLWWHQLATVLRMANLVAAALVLFALLLSLNYDDNYTLGALVLSTVRIAAMTLLAELIARAFLRAREHAADLHAAEFGVEGLLTAVQERETTQTRSVVRSWLRRHPGNDERSQALTNPMRLLAAPIGQVFLGAVTAGAALVSLQYLLLVDNTAPHATPVFTGAVIGIPLTVFTAFGLWRSAWQEHRDRRRPPLTATAVFAGLVIGSHLQPYTSFSGTAPTGIPIALSVLTPLALGTLGLCWWLDALGTAWRRTDPNAARVPTFLWFAVPTAGYVGGWLFAVLWTWSARLRFVHLGCELNPDKPAICETGPEAAVARAVAADHGFTFWSILTVLVVATTLAAPHWFRTRQRRPAVLAVVTALAVATALWTTQSATGNGPRARAEFRVVLDTSSSSTAAPTGTANADRQSTEASAQTAALDALDCTEPDPLQGKANPDLPLVTCARDHSEKFVLSPARMSTVDIADAEAEQSATGFAIRVEFTGPGRQRWEDLTRTSTGQRIAFLVDDEVLAAPQILQPLTGTTVQLPGPFATLAEAEAVAAAIRGD